MQIRDGRLSDETLRHGSAAIVVGRGGWLRVPEQLLRDAGIGGRAEAELGEEGVLLRPSGGLIEAAPAPAAERHDGRDAPAGTAAELVGVHKAYGDGRRLRMVLDGLGHRFAAGRLTVVTGRSGSGKSTVLRLLAGLEPVDAGRVVVLGEELGGRSRAELAAFRREHVAVVAQ